MSNVKDWTKYTWIVPLIAFVIGIISIFTPTATASSIFAAAGMELNLWMWGSLTTNLFTGPGGEIITYTSDIPGLFVGSMICFFIILASLIVVLILVILEKKGSGSGIAIVVFGVIILATIIAYVPVVNAGLADEMEAVYGPTYDLWDFAKHDFGIIGPIISAIIIIAGGSVSVYANKVSGRPASLKTKSTGSPVIPQYSTPSQPANPRYSPPTYSSTTPGGSVGQNATPTFCGQCGAEHKGEGLFCGKCGARF